MSTAQAPATLPSLLRITQNPNRLFLSDLAPELVLQIYTHLPTPSEITSLNLASRYFYQIWYQNASSISGAVLSHYISLYDTTLKLRKLDQLVNYSTARHSASTAVRLEYLASAQTQVREHVASARRDDHRPHYTSSVAFRGVMEKNKELLRYARVGARARMFYQQAACKEGSVTARQRNKSSRREYFLGAFYKIWMLKIANCNSVRFELLKAMRAEVREDVVAVSECLQYDSTPEAMVDLGIGVQYFVPGNGMWMGSLDHEWAMAFSAISVYYRLGRG